MEAPPIGSQSSPLPPLAVNVNQSHIAGARVLGTFSHTTCYPISFVLWTCFLDRSARGTAYAVEGAQRMDVARGFHCVQRLFFALNVKKSKFLFDFLTLSVIIEPSKRKTVEGYLWNRINILRGRWLRSNRHSRLRQCAIIRKSRRHMCCSHLPKSLRDCSQRSLRSAVWICRCSRLVWRRSSPPSRACTAQTASAWGWIWCAYSDVPRSSQSP